MDNNRLARPDLNLRPGLCLLRYTNNPRPLNGTGFYSEEASIRGNTVLHFEKPLQIHREITINLFTYIRKLPMFNLHEYSL